MRDIYTMRDAHEIVGFASTTDLGNGMILIDQLFIDKNKRGKGHGKALLRLICRDADRESSTLGLTFDSDPDMDSERLENLFKEFGFEWLEESVMIRRIND